MTKRKQLTFFILILMALCLAVAAAWYYILYRPDHVSRFMGQVTQDECVNHSSLPVGDVGCFIVVGDKKIYIVHGNLNYPDGWGDIVGFDPLQDNLVGKSVSVYAHLSDAATHSYDLSGKQHYIKLL